MFLRALVLLLVALPALGLDTVTRDRLALVAKIWGAVKYTHPHLGYRDLDWDAAGVRAIERTLAARSENDVLVALDEMLATLNDPATRAEPSCSPFPTPDPPPGRWWMATETAIFIESGAAVDDALKTALRGARTAIIDLRGIDASCAEGVLDPLLVPLIVRGTLELPDHRVVHHVGYRSQEPDFDGGTYSSQFAVEDGGSVTGTAPATLERVVFVVDRHSRIHPVIPALIHSGRAIVLSAGPYRAAGPHRQTHFYATFSAFVRTSELIDGERRPLEPAAHVTLPADASQDAIIAAALDPRGRRRRAVGAARTPLPDYTWRPDATYPAMWIPSIEYRMLAAFRMWNVIHYFYPYKHLIDPWDGQLGPMLDLLAEADTQAEYDLAVAKAMTAVADGHTFVYSKTWLDLRGRAPAPFLLMPVEGKPVVVEITDAGAAAAGVKNGDELVGIDGRAVAERIAELRPYMAASTDAAKEYYLTATATAGPVESTATFTFRRPDGTTYDAALRRAFYTVPTPAKPWRVLTGTRIGYVDLRFLEASQVGAMLSEMNGTEGLIFDIRSYPRGVFPELAWRMNTTGNPVISKIRLPIVRGGELTERWIDQNLGSRGYTPYRGRTAALIDERAQSQSEHTCLTLEAVAGTKFVGTNSVGANGNITYFVLPGSIYVRFTGMDVRHADGRQLQRVGIVPDVVVPRTVDALASGRDEVLEAAVALLQKP